MLKSSSRDFSEDKVHSAHELEGVRLISPCEKPLKGTCFVPGDKSISHRAVLFSAMAEGKSHLSGVLDSADVRASIEAVKKLGAKVELQKQADGSLKGSITGWGCLGPHQPEEEIYCANSGTSARLLMGILAPWDIVVTITGDESLSKRPMRRITAPLMKMGVHFSPAGCETLPITIQGTSHIKALKYNSPMASAQLKTAVLLAGAFAKGTTEINEPSESRNHTELMLPQYGVETFASNKKAQVKGPSTMHACDMVVPGDPSSAAFLVCAACLKEGSDISIKNVSLNTARTGFLVTLERMGANVSARRSAYHGKEPVGDIHASYTPCLHGCEVPGDKIAGLVDEVPVLALVAAHAKGITVFRNVSELRAKESDRLDAIVKSFELIGINAWVEGDDLYIEGQPGFSLPKNLKLDSRKDHRLAMTWSLLALLANEPIEVSDFESVNVSFPSFMDTIEELMR